MPPPVFEDIVHKALASGIRRDILLALGKGEMYLSELAEAIGKKPQTIDFHLHVLAEIGLVTSEWKEGKKYYKITDRKILDFLREKKPVPPKFHHKPPHEIMIEAWEDINKRMDRIEKKLDAISKKIK